MVERKRRLHLKRIMSSRAEADLTGLTGRILQNNVLICVHTTLRIRESLGTMNTKSTPTTRQEALPITCLLPGRKSRDLHPYLEMLIAGQLGELCIAIRITCDPVGRRQVIGRASWRVVGVLFVSKYG
jgi:hypothetical protein